MGLEYYTSRFLLQARARGVEFGRVLTVGRQNFVVTKPQLRKLAREFHFGADQFIANNPAADLVYAEPFFRELLKCKLIESIDVSTYEGASHVHDMNAPLPEALKNQFDTILECGSLEHIFNFPTAIKNQMEAVKVGGTLFLQTPTNNYFGHGFYQFSPELFFRVFSAENGFEIKRIQIYEHFYPCHFFETTPYEVTDPAQLRRRVALVNNRPALLLIEAKRTALKPVFATTPQQSDYVPLWNQNSPAAPAQPPPAPQPVCTLDTWKQKVYGIPLAWVGHLFLQYLGRKGDRPSLGNTESFKRVDQ
jgi:SAM-dependent methyltransferase